MDYKAYFHVGNTSVWDTVEWEIRDATIKDHTGQVFFSLEEVEVPKNFSQLATEIIASKYFRRRGVPNDRGCEYSAKQVIYRIAHTLANAGYKQGHFTTMESKVAFENDLIWLLLHQYGAFNSPVWFNVGLYDEYNAYGTGANYAYNKQSNDYELVGNQYERPQSSACFIQSIDDSLQGIFNLLKKEASLFKYGSGTGSNMSRLRSAQEELTGGGKSSGLLSFLKVFDSAAGAIKSGGTTRRAAVMRCLDIDHPEVLDFIQWKEKEEEKVRGLISLGYSSDFDGEAYGTVSGQNSNNSIRLTDEFMHAVLRDEDWHTTARTTGEIIDTYKARELFNEICEAAWKCADPGVQFDTTINRWHTCLNTDRIYASNPCSEYMFLDDTACNLASINLAPFYESGSFNVEAFDQACRTFYLALEIIVDFASYPSKQIAKNTHTYRTVGLGYANLGSLLMYLGVAYDSEEGRAISGLITAVMTGAAYEMSSDVAAELGAFEGYAENKNIMQRVIKQHADSLSLPSYAYSNNVTEILRKQATQVWENVLAKGAEQGFRNAQTTVLAPTGTIGLLMDCATTGVEPPFSLVMWKKLVGGGVIPMVNQATEEALKNLGYEKSQIQEIADYIQENLTIEGSSVKEEHLPLFDCAVAGGSGVRFIDPMGHVKMMAAVQPFITGAISKTVNLPSYATVQDVSDVFMESWKQGVKAITIYRDSSKASQPLNTTLDEDETGTIQESQELINRLKKENEELKAKLATVSINEDTTDITSGLQWGQAMPLASERRGITWEFSVGGTKVFLRTGEDSNGNLREIFIDLGYKEGSTTRALMNQFAISVSFSLQRGVPLATLVDKFSFTKFEPHGMVRGHAYLKMATSLVDAIFRILGHAYLGRVDFLQVLPEEASTKSNTEGQFRIESVDSPKKTAPQNNIIHAPCGECGGIDFMRTGTCAVCLTCGTSQGCS